MRSLLIVLGGACASLTATLALWAATEAPRQLWVEIVNPRLVRTNASEEQVNLAVERVFRECRAGLHADYAQRVDAWFTERDMFGHNELRLNRFVREQLDTRGRPMRVEVLSGQAMPTLVLIECEDDRAAIAQQLAGVLSEHGAQERDAKETF